MATKNYLIRFGSGSPANYTGLSPTMSLFSVVPGGSALIGPTLTEVPSATGLYTFQYGPTLSVAFICDGGAALAAGDRFVVGILDPIQAVDQKVGASTDTIGTTNIDPPSIYGYVMRLLENLEGNATFDKTTGVWDISSRGGTLIRVKTLTNASGSVTKS